MSDTSEITYVGTHAAITTPAGRVERGESINVPADLADELLALSEKGVKQWKPKRTTNKAADDTTTIDADKEA